jgi:hypothetical protein
MKFFRPEQTMRLTLVGAFVFVLFGLFLTPWQIWSRARAKEMSTWPTVSGTVRSAEVKAVHHKNEGTRYQHAIAYAYLVAGVEHEGKRVSYGGRPPEWETEAQAVEALPAPGATIAVRYSPREPGDSVIHVLELPASTARLLLWVSIGAGAAGAGLMVAGLLELRKRSRAAKAGI